MVDASDPGDIDLPSFYGHDHDLSACKQVTEKCAALVLDIREENVAEVFPGLVTDLQAIGCEVAFASIAPPLKAAGDASVASLDDAEWAKVQGALTKHLADIKNANRGRSLVIQAISAHGEEADHNTLGLGRAPDCGGWGPGPQYPSKYTLFRHELLEKVQAASKQFGICSHVVFDFSCYGGLTAWGLEDLENGGPEATCKVKSKVACANHAADWADVALATSTATGKCGTISPASDKFRGIIAAAAKNHNPGDYGGLVKTLWSDMKGLVDADYADGEQQERAKPPASHPHKGY